MGCRCFLTHGGRLPQTKHGCCRSSCTSTCGPPTPHSRVAARRRRDEGVTWWLAPSRLALEHSLSSHRAPHHSPHSLPPLSSSWTDMGLVTFGRCDSVTLSIFARRRDAGTYSIFWHLHARVRYDDTVARATATVGVAGMTHATAHIFCRGDIGRSERSRCRLGAGTVAGSGGSISGRATILRRRLRRVADVYLEGGVERGHGGFIAAYYDIRTHHRALSFLQKNVAHRLTC